MMDGTKEKKVMENPTKREGTSVQEIVRTQQEGAEVKNTSHCTYICRMNCAMTVECPNLK